jgi:glycine/D-amino acid oxidase-like deaminating enzyme
MMASYLGESARPQVAVVGGGVFGCVSALALAENGCRVTLFERRRDVLLGATYNNHNRVHLGFHYPRAPATAQQSAEGYGRFVQEFAPAIRTGFPNRYFIADHGSRTTPDDYLAALDRIGLSYELLGAASDPETPVRSVALGVLTQESIYDAATLRAMLRARLRESADVKLATNCSIESIEAQPAGGFRLRLAEGWRNTDAVVNCTYAEINGLTRQLGHPVPAHQFEYTAVPIFEADFQPQGITIMDGPFMSVMPFGFSNRMLLYHVRLGVTATAVAPVMPAAWRDPGEAPFDPARAEDRFRAMCDDSAHFIPALAKTRVVGWLHGPRMVLANHDDDDARPSMVQDYGGGYLTLFAGKVDHALDTADEVVARVSETLGLAPAPQTRMAQG